MVSTTVSDLPNEVIQQILLYLPPLCITSFQRVSRRFNTLVEPLLWKHKCQTLYRYWSPQRCIREKYAAEVNSHDWKSIFAERHRVDRITSTTLDHILDSQTGRIDKFQRIVDCGYDAKDCLLRHMKCDDDAEDVLARRYYADAVLGCLHRTMAIKEWADLADRADVSLERALAAFDMFVLHDREGDFDEISAYLDDIAQQVYVEYPDFAEQSPRQKAIALAIYLRSHNLTGLDDQHKYQSLQNNFVGIALYDDDHPSLPLISTAIYCFIAKRLGLDARPCGFPFHVYTLVVPPSGFDLDGLPVGARAKTPRFMYMDPFRSVEETPATDLQAQLRQIGASSTGHAHVMGPAPTPEMVLRSSRNILASVQDAHRNAMVARHGGIDRGSSSNLFPDLESAFYGALWACLLLGISPGGDGPVVAMVQRRNFLPHIVEQFETHFPTDAALIERYIVPLFQNFGEYAQLRDAVRVMRAGDSMPKQIKARNNNNSSKDVRYRVGQVFQHKRYGYIAVITGWDVECSAGPHWEAQMRVHELPRGRNQSFYHVLVEDKGVRYVAEENVEIITPALPPHDLMALAGRHFKRWDKEARRFVSNIRDEYPDD